MQNFKLSLQEEVNIYMSNNLTPNELFMLRLLFIAQDGDTTLLINYVSNTSGGKQLLKEILISLQQKQVINNSFRIPKEGEELNFKQIPFNKNFIKRYIKDSNSLGKELLEIYPPFLNINGKMCSLKNFTKAGLFSVDEFCIFYAKSIKNSQILHERILEALSFGKEHNLINYSLLEFIASQKYLEIEYIKNSGDINGYNNTELL